MHLLVEISQERVESGQPHSEIIVAESLMSWPDFISESFVETSRFSNWQQNGNISNRYYHLMGRGNGLCLNVEAANNRARLIFGVYAKRSLVFPQRRLLLAECVESASELTDVYESLIQFTGIYSDIVGGGTVAFKYNCIEFYDKSKFAVLGSIKIPVGLILEFGFHDEYSAIVKKWEVAFENGFADVSAPDAFGHVVDARVRMDFFSCDTGRLGVSCLMNASGISRRLLIPLEVASVNFF